MKAHAALRLKKERRRRLIMSGTKASSRVNTGRESGTPRKARARVITKSDNVLPRPGFWNGAKPLSLKSLPKAPVKYTIYELRWARVTVRYMYARYVRFRVPYIGSTDRPEALGTARERCGRRRQFTLAPFPKPFIRF